jgi:hypothetical protein
MSVTANPVKYCPNCSLLHDGGPCDHDAEAPCFSGCGRPRGLRWLGNDRREVKPRTRCWYCWDAAGMPGLAGVAVAIDDGSKK